MARRARAKAKTAPKAKPRAAGARRARPGAAARSRRVTGAEAVEAAAVTAALALAERRSWSQVTLADIAREAGLSLAVLLAELPSKTAVLAAFQRRIDREVLAGGEVGDASARDRLFELLMRRFEALKPHRQALKSILMAAPHDPASVICGWSGLLHAMITTLALAGLPAEGLGGLFRAKWLALIYGSVLPVFFADGTRDLSRTMAALDARLRRVEEVVNWARGWSRSGK